jgi:hypothetical protein
MTDERDTQQDVKIAKLETDSCWMKDKLGSIDIQVTNHIPTKLDNLDKKIDDNKLSSTKWLLGIMVSIVMLLMATIVNIILK